MKAVSRRILGISFLFFGGILSSGAEEGEAVLQLTQGDFQWSVGFSLLQAPQNNPAALSAAALFPRLLRSDVGSISQHRLWEGERVYLISQAVEKKIKTHMKNLASIYNSRDQLLFELEPNPDEVAKKDDAIAKERESLRQWENFSFDEVAVPEEVPVVLPAPPEGGLLWPASRKVSYQSSREKTNLDLLITGSLEAVGDYYAVQVVAVTQEKEEVLWEGAGSEGDLPLLAEEASGAVRRLVLGRDWAGLSVQADPPLASIWVNDQILGVGTLEKRDFEAGVHVVEISHPGYEPWTGNYVIAPSFVRKVAVTLSPKDQNFAFIRSLPTGASVRLGSIYMGKAPLSLILPDHVEPLTLELEGFQPRSLPLSPDTSRITVPLESFVEDPEVTLAKGRKRLYRSLTWFALSLAVPMIFSGVSENYMGLINANSEAYQQTGNLVYRDAAIEAKQAYNISSGIMWGGIVLTAGLLTNALFKLAEYLQTAEVVTQ